MWKSRSLMVSGIALVGALATACGGSSSGGGGTQSVGTGSGGSGGSGGTVEATDLQTHSGPDGKFMTDEDGRTVYIFSKDTSSTPTCSGACAKEWPPYTEHGSQELFKGHPLYFFANDSSAGDMNGQGLNDFGGLWTAVAPDGSPLQTAQPSNSPSSGGSSSEWG